MAPLRKAPPVSRRGRQMVEVEGDTQAGRSASSLRAERAAADIRPKTSSPNEIGRGDSGSTLQDIVSNSTEVERSSSTSSFHRTSSYAPVVPSQFNPSSSHLSIKTDEENEVVDEVLSPIASSSSSSGQFPQSQRTGNMLPIGRENRRSSSTLSQTQELLQGNPVLAIRPEAPKLLKDLGEDYSRYPQHWPNRSSYSGTPGPFLASEQKSSLVRTTSSTAFSDSQADLEKLGYPNDSIGAFDPYFGGEKGFILYRDEVEADDKYHMPADDDDLVYKPSWKDYLNARAVISAMGGVALILGLLCVFILLPIMTYVNKISPLNGPSNQTNVDADPQSWAYVNNRTYPLLKNVRTGLIDPDTPVSARTRTSIFDGSTLNLVFSDEFNTMNRTFYPGDDAYWTAPNIWYGSTEDLEWYDPDAVTTGDGTLQLRMDAFPNHNLQYRSGMLNSWNQLCFKGGVFEVSLSLAGPSGVPGLWPAVWTLGNLARPGYRASSDGIWPYTYTNCDLGITPNQSSPDGLSYLPGQKLSSCTCDGEDHPNPGTGRGAPEIDILEASVDPNNRIGVVTQSYQVAPFDIFWRPNANFMQIPNYETTSPNAYCGGPYQQAISGTTLLNNEWYDGNEYQKYAFEYIPGNSSTGKISWFVGEEQSFMLDGRAIGQNGNVGPRQISEEPMSMVLNLGMSNSWSQILFDSLKFPTIMHIDYVRIYQKPGEEMITCDPPGYPTTEYIANHAVAYSNPNLTSWHETGYSWPKNKLTGC